MAPTQEMIDFARAVKPHLAMLVPENRQEITTEGGLDVAGRQDRLRHVVAALESDGLVVSAFIDPDPHQIEAAHACGFTVCEIHTGPYANAFWKHGRDPQSPPVVEELKKVREAGVLIRQAGMRFNAGHGLNYYNVQPIAALTGVRELHIGHSIVSRAVIVGMRSAVAEMKRLMREAAKTHADITTDIEQ